MSLFGNEHDMLAKTGAKWRPFARIGRNNRSEGVLQAQTKAGRVGAVANTTNRVVGKINLRELVIVDASVEGIGLGTLGQIVGTGQCPLVCTTGACPEFCVNGVGIKRC